MNKTDFLVLQEIIIDKMENLIEKQTKKTLLKKTNPIKVLPAQSARAG